MKVAGMRELICCLHNEKHNFELSCFLFYFVLFFYKILCELYNIKSFKKPKEQIFIWSEQQGIVHKSISTSFQFFFFYTK